MLAFDKFRLRKDLYTVIYIDNAKALKKLSKKKEIGKYFIILLLQKLRYSRKFLEQYRRL